jgi:uncharacterized phage protein gp47/JayE
MSYKKTFDELLNALLTDYKNQFPEADTSKGSLIYVKAAALASALWGLYEHQGYISDQIFPDTADSRNLDHWAYTYGVSRKAGESDKELLSRLLNRIQQPPAGGNENDYEQWALTITNVEAAYCYPLIYGLATVGVLVVADETATGSEIPSSHTGLSGTNTSVSAGKLVDTAAAFQAAGVKPGDTVKNDTTGKETTVSAVDSETELTLADDVFTGAPENYSLTSLVTEVKDYIESVQPVLPAGALNVFGPTIATQDVTMTVTGDEADTALIKSDVEAYLKGLKPDQTLYVSQLIAIALQDGAENAAVTVPAADVAPASYAMLRPGVVSVT